MRRLIYSLLLPALILATHLRSEDAAVVSRIKVLSDKVEDVSTIDTWKKAFIKDGMTDEQKALSVYQSVVKFRHQDPPPNEYITGDGGDVHDPIKTFNVYGYNMCCCESSNICALSRYAGLKARGWGINSHSVPEVGWGDKWHLLDASLVCYFKKPDGQIAGVEDLIADVTEWYAKNPEFKNNDDKLRKFMRGGGWKKGPPILANTTAYDDNGWLPAATHGWYSTVQEYDGRGGGHGGKAFLYEYGYAQGYEVNIQLRPGEKLTRNWFNKGLHINAEGGGGTPGCLKEKVTPNSSLRYSLPLGDLAPGRIGNGTHVYDAPLASKVFLASALTAENLASKVGGGPALHAKDAAQPGVLILRMPSSYVYLSGELKAKTVVADGGSIAVALSENNGLDWKEVSTITQSGDQVIDLKPLVYRRYDYRLRLTLKGKGTGLETLTLSHDIQHSQRPLPALDKGENKISFSTGAQEGTITVHANGSLEHKGKQVMYTDFHPVLDKIQPSMIHLSGGSGSIAFPVSTPGEMTRLRFGSFYRARDAADGWDYQVSFDGGKTYKTVDRAAGPTGNGLCKYVVFTDIPAGTKEALVRFAGTQRNTTLISHFRIDADYKMPNGGFRPVKITYQWEEDGQAKQDVRIARKAEENYTINCASKPLMKSIILELAD
jgi:hypothetical protein